MFLKGLRKLFSAHNASEKLTLNHELSKTDKTIIGKKLKGDIFGATDPEYQFRPIVSPVDYYRLHHMDFNWIILDPMSRGVTEFSEKTGSDLQESVKILSPGQKMLYFWWYLDGQVTNGGFSQFIYNGYDRYFQPILNGLRLLPDQRYYTLVEKVYAYYLKEGLDCIDRSQIDYFKDKFHENNFLKDADNAYFSMNDQLYKDVENFIRNNQESFIQPIEKGYTGETTSRTENVLERLEVQNGVPEGRYTKYIDDVQAEEIVYGRGKEVIRRKFQEGILHEEEKDDDSIKNLVHTLEYYPNGKLKAHLKKKVKGKHNSKMIFRERYYESGIVKAQFWEDDTQTMHIKRYFTDGQLRSYHTFRQRNDGAYGNVERYLVCFDENRKETLIDGNGVFYDYDFKEDMSSLFFNSIVNCENYLANGECVNYKNGQLWYRTTYVNGLEHGLHIEYDENGNEKSIREFENGWFVRHIKKG